MTLTARSATTEFIRSGQVSADASPFDSIGSCDSPRCRQLRRRVHRRSRGAEEDRRPLVLLVQRRVPVRRGQRRAGLRLAGRPARPRAGDGGEHLLLLALFGAGLFRRDARAASALAIPVGHGRRRHVADRRVARLRSLVRCLAADDRRHARHVGQRRPRDPQLRSATSITSMPDSWRWTLLVCAAPIVLASSSGSVVPESRRWLAARDAPESRKARRLDGDRLSSAALAADAHRHRRRHDPAPRRLGRDAVVHSLGRQGRRRGRSAGQGPGRHDALRRRSRRRPDRRLAGQPRRPAARPISSSASLRWSLANTSTSTLTPKDRFVLGLRLHPRLRLHDLLRLAAALSAGAVSDARPRHRRRRIVQFGRILTAVGVLGTGAITPPSTTTTPAPAASPRSSMPSA